MKHAWIVANVREPEFPQRQPGFGSAWDNRTQGVEKVCNTTEGKSEYCTSTNDSVPAHRLCAETTMDTAVELNLALTCFGRALVPGGKLDVLPPRFAPPCNSVGFPAMSMVALPKADFHLPSACTYFCLQREPSGDSHEIRWMSRVSPCTAPPSHPVEVPPMEDCSDI